MTDLRILEKELALLSDEKVAEVLEGFADGMQEGSVSHKATMDEHVAMLSIIRTLRHVAKRLKSK